MNEHEPVFNAETRHTPEQVTPDWRRLEVARTRFIDRVADGIAQALAEHTEISNDTARMIAHVLGRAYGRDSHLAEFGRTGEGAYLSMRDEYLHLYNSEHTDAITKEWVDWLGTYLIQRENTGSGRQYMNEHVPPKLNQLLVATELYVRGVPYRVHLPASLDSEGVDALSEELINLSINQDEALQAFLTLPDVDANTPMLMESFHETFAGSYPNEEAMLRALSPLEDWENSLADWCIDHGIEFDVLEWNYEPLLDRLRDIYDIVDWKEQLHAFAK